MRFPATLILYFPLDLLADQSSNAQAAVDPVSGGYLLRLSGGLLLVVAAIFFFAWLLKRFKLTQQSQSNLLRIVAGLAVGTRERIVILQVGDEQLLLGISAGRIEKLHQLSKPIEVDSNHNPGTAFAQKLNQLMSKGRQ